MVVNQNETDLAVSCQTNVRATTASRTPRGTMGSSLPPQFHTLLADFERRGTANQPLEISDGCLSPQESLLAPQAQTHAPGEQGRTSALIVVEDCTATSRATLATGMVCIRQQSFWTSSCCILTIVTLLRASRKRRSSFFRWPAPTIAAVSDKLPELISFTRCSASVFRCAPLGEMAITLHESEFPISYELRSSRTLTWTAGTGRWKSPCRQTTSPLSTPMLLIRDRVLEVALRILRQS